MNPLRQNISVVVFAVCALAFGHNVFADEDSSVVKIKSVPCKSNSAGGDTTQLSQAARMGSGAVVKTPSGRNVILTSSHVVYHGGSSEGICTYVKSRHTEWVEAPLLHVNGGMGIAALQAPDSFVDGFSFGSQIPAQSAQLSLTGFPLAADATQSPMNGVGRVLNQQSQRILLPLVPAAIEVEGAHSEYGMSGGAALDQTNKSYVGMISHQYLRINPGQRALVQESANAEAPPAVMIALVIPASLIVSWLEKPTDLKEDISVQMKGLVALTFGSVRFAEVECDKKSHGEVGGDGVGVGGHGGDGVGVGGDTDQSKICDVLMERVSGDLSNTQPWPLASSADWFTDLSNRMKEQPIRTKKMIDPETLVSQPVKSLYQVLTLMSRGYRPEFLGVKAAIGAMASQYLVYGRDAHNRIMQSIDWQSSPGILRTLDSDLEILFDAFEAGNLSVVKPKNARALLEREGVYAPAWV